MSFLSIVKLKTLMAFEYWRGFEWIGIVKCSSRRQCRAFAAGFGLLTAGLQIGFGESISGTNTLSYFLLGESTRTNLQTSPVTTSESGSSFVAWVGRGETNGFIFAPSDNKGNRYIRQGNFEVYLPDWPRSGCAVYVATNAVGGSNHQWNVYSTPSDETTLLVMEVKNGTKLGEVRFNRVASPPQTSASVTTAGPALLVAVWAGDQGYPLGLSVGNGFTIQVKKAEPPPPTLYVQGAIAAKEVSAAGDYNVTWTSIPNEGANMWMLYFSDDSPKERVRLEGVRIEDRVVFSWPSSAVGYSLQWTTAPLEGETSWVTVDESPVLVGEQFVITNQVFPDHRWFRLYK